MCQVLASYDLSPFAPDLATHMSKKRARSDATSSTPVAETASPATSPRPQSPVSVDTMHYNLRTKRARPATAVDRHASPRAAANKVKSRRAPASSPSSSTLTWDLNHEVKTLHSNVAAMQAQVQDAAAGIRELRHMVALLALQRRRAEMLALYQRTQQQQQQQQQHQECAVQS